MAVPKQRHNTSRGARRRKHNESKAKPVTVQKCASCGEMKVPHRMCEACGMYRGVQYKEVVTTAGK